LCAIGSLQAQDNFYFKKYTSENGLPHNSIKCLTQDKTGFLWIATWDGLSRFDGYEFRNYYHNPSDSTSLPFFIIQKIVVDKLNNLWALTAEKQVAIYDRSTDTFHQTVMEPDILPTDMTTDLEGNVWLAGINGISRFDYQKKLFRHVDMLDEHAAILSFENSTPVITFDNKGNIYVFCEGAGKCKIYKSISNEKSKVVFHYINSLTTDCYYSKRIFNSTNSFKVLELTENNIWLFTNFGFLGKIGKNGSVADFKGEIPKGELDGLSSFAWSKNEPEIPYYNSARKFQGSIPTKIDERPNTSYFDKENTLWYCTVDETGEGTGLTQAIEVQAHFKHYFLDQNKSSVSNAIYAVMKTKNGEIWAAPRNLNYLFRLEANGELIKCNALDEKTWNLVRHPRAFHEDSTGIYIGYYRNMLTHFDPTKEKFSVIKFNQTDQILPGIPPSFRGFESNGKNLIINSDGAIYNYSSSIDKMDEVWSGKTLKTPIYCLKKDSFGNYWVGLLSSTLKCLDSNFKEIASYRLSKERYNVEDICLGDNNDLWAALLGGGVVHLDLKNGKTETLTSADGLSNNTANSILKDKSGNLWISTDRGLSKYNPKTRQFRIFGLSDGLKIDAFNTDAAFQSSDGEMLFGGMGGVVGFYPDSLKETATGASIKPIVITDFKVSGIPHIFPKAVYDLDTVSLQKGEDNFQLNFACIDFKNGDKIKYRYQLIGEDESFTQIDNRHRFINYANLTPGDYCLEIEATNPDGDWISKKSLVIQIPSLYYQTLWFRLLAIVFFLSTIVLFVWMYNRQVRLRASRKQAELRLESLRGQMNPHFIFNSLNSINYFISQNDRLSANRYIADFSRLIRSFLGNLSKEYISFESELETLKDYLQLEHLRFGDKFDYKLIVDDNFEPENKMIFPGMVQPFVENAIWHGVRGLTNRKGNITIQFLPGSSDHCICIVEDDGIGRKLSLERKNLAPGKKSNGIAIVTERLKIINQIRQKNFQLKVEDLFQDREESGTKFTIEIPLKTNT
jgi:ligand-binding sensor domain-containing protein/two-component sensor histidine kinase